MPYRIVPSVEFLKKAKRLAKKHSSFKNDLKRFTDSLEEEPRQGVQIKPDVYKIRIAIKSKGRGKSSGARAITFIETEVAETEGNLIVHLVTIYDKTEMGNISDGYIGQVIEEIKSVRKEEE